MKKQSSCIRAGRRGFSPWLRLAALIMLLGLLPAAGWSQKVIVDHTCTRIGQIPEAAIAAAKQNLHIAYGHTSHGSQLTDGMTGLVAFANNHGLGLYLPTDIFAWNQGGTDGALDLHDYAMDGDVGYYPAWVSNTRSYLGAANGSGRGSSHPNVNVIIWSWCGQASGLTAAQMTSNYLTPMSQLESAYFGIRFVYMTGHLDGSGSSGNLAARNQQIRDYCNANNKVLYDFADIESYDPAGLTHYMPLGCNDNCDYDSDNNGSLDRNWALAWQNSHTENVDWYDCSAAHTQALNGNLKAYAAWWLWARLGGWSGGSGTQYSIAGRVTAGSKGLAGVALNGLPGSPGTDSNGYYSTWVDAGWSGTATPTRTYYAFDPPSTTYTSVAANQTTNYATTLSQSLVITAPDAAVWERSRTYAITWLKQGPQNGYVKINLYRGISTWVKTLSSKTANDGTWDWLVPAGLAAGSTYFIRVQTLDNTARDDSAKFSIIVPAIKVTAPAAGSVWVKGVSKTIAWTRTGTQDANVTIRLFLGTAKKLDVALSAPNSGAYDWTVPSTLASAVYTIQVSTLDNKVKGKSPSFSIVNGLIKVTQPTAGSKWQRGVAHTITWTREGTLNANVRIQLFKGTTLVSTPAASTPNDGSFDWTIPGNQPLAANYKLRIITADNLVRGNSGFFSITNTPGLLLLAPNGEGILQPGAVQAIRWSHDPGIIEVKLEYSRNNGGTFYPIADHVENTGSFTWTVPVHFTRTAIVRVSDGNGRPWQENGILEYSFKFICDGEGEAAGATIWFGGAERQGPGYGFAKIVLGNDRIEFGGKVIRIEPPAAAWHELRLRFDFRRDTAGLELDGAALFENTALATGRNYHFEPCLTVRAGGSAPMELGLDDLQISIVEPGGEDGELERRTVLSDTFDGYDEKANSLHNCWRWQGTDEKETRVMVENGAAGDKTLRLGSAAGKSILLCLPFDIPARVPFDISDRCLVIENK